MNNSVVGMQMMGSLSKNKWWWIFNVFVVKNKKHTFLVRHIKLNKFSYSFCFSIRSVYLSSNNVLLLNELQTFFLVVNNALNYIIHKKYLENGGCCNEFLPRCFYLQLCVGSSK